MQTDLDPQATADDPLRPAVCPRCDYPLTGLPVAGFCPECGRAYGDGTAHLYGYAAGSKARQTTGKPPSAVGLAFGWATTLAMIGFVWVHGRGNTTSLIYLWTMPASLIGLAITTWRRQAGTGSGVVRVAIGPAGVSQGVRGFGPVPFERADRATPVSWGKVRRVRVRPRRDGQVRLTLSSTDLWWMWRLDHVDAIVRCTPEQLAGVRERIDRWRGAA